MPLEVKQHTTRIIAANCPALCSSLNADSFSFNKAAS
jgi:hypothetical protein